MRLALAIAASVVAAIVAYLSVRVGQRSRKLMWGLVVSLVVACAVQIVFSILDDKDRQHQSKVTEVQSQRIQGLSDSVGSLRLALTALDTTLLRFGLTPERLATMSAALESFKADWARTELLRTTDPRSRPDTRVEYYAKEVDREIVDGALQDLGFRLEPSRPQLPDTPTNAIWFGAKVQINNVKLVAYTLMRAGVRISAIRPFRDAGGVRADLVQVGSDAQYLGRKPLTVAQIRSATAFGR